MMKRSVIVKGKVTWLAKRETRMGFEKIRSGKIKEGKVVTVVPPSDIKLHRECQSMTMHSCEPIHEFAYKGEWCGDLGGECIKFVVILHQS